MKARATCGQQAAHFIILDMQTAGNTIKVERKKKQNILAIKLYTSSGLISVI